MKKLNYLLPLLLTVTLFSPAAFSRGGSGGGNHGGGDKPICTGQEPPRQGAAYTGKQSMTTKIDDYLTALSQYETEHPEAAAFAAISRELSGVSCFVDDDCATGDNSKFVAACVRYEWDGTNGTCRVASVTPIPLPPPSPIFTCEDVSCPSIFQCEFEESTRAVGCVEQRSCRPR